MFRWAASEELLPVAVYQALATVPGLHIGRTEARKPAPVRPVADAVVEATLAYVPRPRPGGKQSQEMRPPQGEAYGGPLVPVATLR